MKTNLLRSAALLAFLCASVLSAPAQSPESSSANPAATGDNTLIVQSFRVPPDFLTRGGTVQEEPPNPGEEGSRTAEAAAKTAKKNADKRNFAQKVLESLGVSFATAGSSVSYDKGNSVIVVRNTRAQLQLVETLVAGMNASGPAEAFLHFDVISLPALAARKAVIAHPVEAELYQWLDTELEKKDSGVVLERFCSMRIRSGQRSKVQGINEYPYPTELDPPQIPQSISLIPGPATSVGIPGDDRKFTAWPHSAVTPGSFADRNLGMTVEAELSLSEDLKAADINLAPEVISLVTRIPMGITGDISQPVFGAQKSSSQVHAWVGQPALVSTLSPASDTGVAGGNKDNRVWLLFVTVTRPQ